MAWLNIAKILDVTEAEGPGRRLAIWTQGCLKRCQGCCNGELLRIKPAHIYESSEIITRIVNSQVHYQIEGITLLGGEPFLQAEGLAEIAQASQQIGLSVMIFTGYQLEELGEENFKGSEKLLQFTDILIDGEYEIENTEMIRNWVGSTNQRFHYMTNFYDPDIETQKLSVTNEWRISSSGQIIGNGLPFSMKL